MIDNGEYMMQLPLYENKDTQLNIMLETILSPRRYPWFYERFVNISISGEYDFFVSFTDLEANECFRSFFESYVSFEFDKIKNVAQAFQIIDQSIEESYYCNVWIDKYYVPDTDEYMTCHFFHPVLVYGIDNEGKNYLVSDFTGSRGVFKHKIDAADFYNAISCVKANREAFDFYSNGAPIVECFKIDNIIEKHDFSLQRFTAELENYIYSRKNTFNDEFGRERFPTSYGVDTYKKLFHFFENKAKCTLPFKAMFDLRLHKRFLYDRLCFIKENYNVSQVYSDSVGTFKKVADIFNLILNANVRRQMKGGLSPNCLCSDADFEEWIVKLLHEAENIERTILPLILGELLKRPSDKYYPVLDSSTNGITQAMWQFDKNRTFRFVAENVKNIEYSDGISLEINGEELRFVHRHVDIDAEKAKNITVELWNTSTAPDVYFDFTTYENVDFSDNMSIKLDVPMQADFSKIDIDMSGKEFWSGRILDIRIRLKSDCKSKGSLTIKKISIF